MDTNQLKFGLIGAVLGGICVWALFSMNAQNNGFGMMNRGSNTANTAMRSEQIDAHFIEQMIPHHEDAITMSELAQTKAQRKEVKELASNIITAQGKEIDQMKAWYADWFNKEVPEGNDVMNEHGMMGGSGAMHMGMMGDSTDVSSLETSKNFDTDFLEGMIPHHQMAIMMAQMLKNSTERPEMKQLADDIIESQSREIDQMRQWLKDWR